MASTVFSHRKKLFFFMICLWHRLIWLQMIVFLEKCHQNLEGETVFTWNSKTWIKISPRQIINNMQNINTSPGNQVWYQGIIKSITKIYQTFITLLIVTKQNNSSVTYAVTYHRMILSPSTVNKVRLRMCL